MNFDVMSQRIHQINKGLVVVCTTLALTFGLVVFTPILSLPHDGVVVAELTADETSRLSSSSISKAAVTNATRGKAIFRTLREIRPPAADTSNRYILTGTSIRDGKIRAYVKDTKLKQTFRVYVGDTLGRRYRVMAIHKSSIELQRGSELISLRK